MSKFIKFIAIICIMLSLVGCVSRTVDADIPDDGKLLFLVAGLDDAAENTDVLFTVGFDSIKNQVFVAQIPRDTYFAFGGGQNKINQLFASNVSLGQDKNTAMENTTLKIAQALGADIDGYIAIGSDTFAEIVDVIGGVEIELSSDMIIEFDGEAPIYLHAGMNHIDSKIAERFVRYRRGYSTQDLGRIDAQKIFLNALFWKLSSGLSLPTLISLAGRLQDGAYTNIKLRELVPVFWRAITEKEDAKSNFVTLPGEAALSDSGLSYYILNRSACSRVTQKYMFTDGNFDKDRLFKNEKQDNFINIYEDDTIDFIEYSSDNIKDIPLNKK